MAEFGRLQGRAPQSGDQRIGFVSGRRWPTRLLFLAVLLSPAFWSYGRFLNAPGNGRWDDRSVEWIRIHGGESLVDHVEQWWYTRGSPGNGVPLVGTLPAVPAAVPARVKNLVPLLPSEAPVEIVAVVPDPMPGEGVWTPGVQKVDGSPVLYTAFLRPDVENTKVLAGVVWFDQKLVRTVAVPGTFEPGGSGWVWDSGIPESERTTLVAAFNSGFKFRHISGGYYTEGRTARPLVDGQASLVIGSDGTIDVVQWGRDATMGPGVVSVRQNLQLIVDGGAPVSGLKHNADSKWGRRRHQLQLTWRSGVGVTADGNFVVVAGDKMSLTALAEALSRVGAVRGMQLDIHTGQVAVNLFQPARGEPTRVTATKLLPQMPRPATRFLTADDRDFFAVFAR